MFTKTLLCIGLLAAAPLANASSTTALARATGLTERNIGMLFGGRTAYTEYPVSYNRVLRQFKQALGEDNYQKLMRGETIVLEIKHGEQKNDIAGLDADKP
ncbi:MAG: hypothetical protein ABWY01_02205 [Pseudoxanthomonas sp.]